MAKEIISAGIQVPAAEVKRIKALGFLQDKRYSDIFNVRVITGNGKMDSDKFQAVIDAANKFGSGEIAVTTRLTLEIQGVRYDKIDELLSFLADNGLETGGTGAVVRPVVSCKGTTCQYGLIDTYELSRKIHERFYQGYHQVKLPHKFKIAVGGCPNNCVKPDLNDLGIIGQRVPFFDSKKCRGCVQCQIEKLCPMNAVEIRDGKVSLNESACTNCGRCAGKCPFGVTASYKTGYKICIGGRWGKKSAHGIAINKLFTDEEEVLSFVERAILLFRREGIAGERFADTVNRLGFENVQEMLLHGEIDREEILSR